MMLLNLLNSALLRYRNGMGSCVIGCYCGAGSLGPGLCDAWVKVNPSCRGMPHGLHGGKRQLLSPFRLAESRQRQRTEATDLHVVVIRQQSAGSAALLLDLLL